MTNRYEIPRKMPRYLKRLASEYRNRGEVNLANVLEGSKFQVNEETTYDNWDGGMNGHDLLLLVPDELMGHIPLDEQNEIQSRLREDLNKASSAAQSEYVSEVHFEYLEDDDKTNRSMESLTGYNDDDSAITRLWKPDTIKMFISHRDTWKKSAHELADELSNFGVSSFVAHDTIEPDEDWQKEIEKALQSMDALLAIVTDDFFDSAWTNQEIGFALARGVPVISIKFENTDPIGFIRNRQAIKSLSPSMSENAKKVFETVEKRIGDSASFRTSMIVRLNNSKNFWQSEEAFGAISRIENISAEELDMLITAFNSNSQIYNCWALTTDDRYFNFLKKHSSKKLIMRGNKIEFAPNLEDEVPF